VLEETLWVARPADADLFEPAGEVQFEGLADDAEVDLGEM
jgi:hypothetical protein